MNTNIQILVAVISVAVISFVVYKLYKGDYSITEKFAEFTSTKIPVCELDPLNNPECMPECHQGVISYALLGARTRDDVIDPVTRNCVQAQDETETGPKVIY